MLTCADVSPLLDDLIDGTLHTAQRAAADAHLASCPSCRAELHGLEALVASAQALPRDVPPPQGVWHEIDAALDRTEGRLVSFDRGWVRMRRGTLAAAAAALVVLSVALSMAVLPEPPRAAVSVPDLPGRYAVTEARYLAAARELEAALRSRQGSLGPDAMLVIERSLAVIDGAIREAREALAGAPEEAELARVLWAGHQRRLDFLQRANRL